MGKTLNQQHLEIKIINQRLPKLPPDTHPELISSQNSNPTGVEIFSPGNFQTVKELKKISTISWSVKM